MGNFFCRLFAPWKAEGCFDELDDFYDFLLRRNRALNAVRVLFFAAAAVCLSRSRIIFLPLALWCWRLGCRSSSFKMKSSFRPSFKTPNPDQMVCRSLRQTIFYGISSCICAGVSS